MSISFAYFKLGAWPTHGPKAYLNKGHRLRLRNFDQDNTTTKYKYLQENMIERKIVALWKPLKVIPLHYWNYLWLSSQLIYLIVYDLFKSHHLCVSFSLATKHISVYQNGALIQTETYHGPEQEVPAGTRLYIYWEGGTTNGTLGDVIMWNRSLSTSEIKSIASCNYPSGVLIRMGRDNVNIAGDVVIEPYYCTGKYTINIYVGSCWRPNRKTARQISIICIQSIWPYHQSEKSATEFFLLLLEWNYSKKILLLFWTNASARLKHNEW